MDRRFAIPAAAVAVVATALAFTSTAEATSRAARLGHKLQPAGTKLPAEVTRIIEKEFPGGKIGSSWTEDKGTEMEVAVTPKGSNPIEVVFRKTAKGWQLIGFEYPVPAASLTPRAEAALHSKYSNAKILEVEMVFSPNWQFLGYQVTLQNGGVIEVFVRADGTFAKDPL
jgi:hypothetical protein